MKKRTNDITKLVPGRLSEVISAFDKSNRRKEEFTILGKERDESRGRDTTIKL